MGFKVIAPMVRKHAQLSPLPANAQQPQDQLLPKISLLNHALTEPLELMPNAQPVSHKKLPAHAQTKSMVFKRLIAPMERKHAQLSPLPAHAQTKSMVFKRLIAPMVRKHAQLSPLPAHAQTKSMVFKHLIAPMVRKHAQPVSHKKLLA